MQDEDRIEQLLKIAGRRSEPDPDVAAEIELSTRQAWMQTVRAEKRKRQRKLFGLVGAAAIVVLAVAMGIYPGFVGNATPIATLAHSSGEFSVNRSTVSSKDVYPGDVIETGNNGFLSLSMPNQTTLVFAENTTLKIESATQVSLTKGRLYFDSLDPETALTIHTSWGNVVDVGTQYELSINNNALKVALREGEVKLNLKKGTHHAMAANGFGDVLLLNRQYEVKRSQMATTDIHWNWVLNAAAELDLNGKSIYEVLTWVGRMTGKNIVYATTQAKNSAMNTHLSGGSLDPKMIEDTLPLILNTTQLSANFSTQRIEIDLISAP